MSSKLLTKSLKLCALLAVAPLSFGEEPDEWLETPLALAFGAPPTIGEPMLSPDGSRLLFIQQNPAGVSILRSLDFASGEIRTLVQGTDGGYDIHWCEVANETRVVCDLRVDLFEHDPQHQQLVAVNIDGSDLRTIRAIGGRRPEGEFNPRSETPPSYCRSDFDQLRNRPTMLRLLSDPDRVLFFCEGLVYDANVNNGNVRFPGGAGFVGDRYETTIIWRYNPGLGGYVYAGVNEADPGTFGRRQRLYSNGSDFAEIYRGTQNDDRWFIREAVSEAWEPLLNMPLPSLSIAAYPRRVGSAWPGRTMAHTRH